MKGLQNLLITKSFFQNIVNIAKLFLPLINW